MVKVGRFEYEKSTRKGKKLMVRVDGKLIHFGDNKMQHFKDKTGIWKSLDHNDKERRKSYLARSGGQRNKKGELLKDKPTSAVYHARRVLW
tara:strand:+ start:81 stop:353 length:273 start_codon:yes stop_codon:yes gene_type:complete